MRIGEFIKNFEDHVIKIPSKLKNLNSEKIKEIALKTAAVVLATAVFAALASFALPVVIALISVPVIALAAGVVGGVYFTAEAHAETLDGKLEQVSNRFEEKINTTSQSILGWFRKK